MVMITLIEVCFSHIRKIEERDVTLLKDQSKLDIGKRTINEWNKSSTDYVNATSVNMFKTKIY